MFPKLVTMMITFAVLVLSDGMMAAKDIDSELVGYWKLNGDFTDSSGHNNDGRGFGVDLSAAGRGGKPNTAARFNGIDAMIEVADSESLQFGTGDFSIAAWIQLDEDVADVVGDIVSKFDDESRRGFNFYVKSSSATYNSRGDNNIPVFGIDNAMDGPWQDCGKLWPSNTYISSLTVYKGELYGGIADAVRDEDACHVFRYGGGTRWLDCGRVGDSLRTRSAYSMIVHKGQLYCGTGRYDWVTTSPETCDFVRVYQYDGDKRWIDCGQPGDNLRILSLASFKGELYAGTDCIHAPVSPNTGKVFRYAGGQEWVDCGRLGSTNHVFSMAVHNGHLYGGTTGEVYRYEGGTDWTYIGTPINNRQVHCLQVYKGDLYAGTWPEGAVCCYEGGTQWRDCGKIGLPLDRPNPKNEVNDLTVYNGKLYAGVLPKGEVWRYEGGRKWTLMRRMVSNPDWVYGLVHTWARAPCLTEFGGTLYVGTAACRGYAEENPHFELGRVYSYTAGRAASYDAGLESGWQHLVGVRDGQVLKLYVNAELEATSEPFLPEAYDLSNNEVLHIGFGAIDHFSGNMDDLRIYNRALDAKEVTNLYQQPAG